MNGIHSVLLAQTSPATGFYGLSIGHSVQFERPAIVVRADDASPEDVITLANEHGATYMEEDGESFVVDFKIPGSNCSEGPSIYTKEALRKSLTKHRRKPS